MIFLFKISIKYIHNSERVTLMQRESIYKNYIPGVTAPENIENQKAYWFVFSQNRLLVKDNPGSVSIPYATNLQEINLTPVRIQYLGTLDDSPCYSAEIDISLEPPANYRLCELRSLYGLVDEELYLLAGKAYQIVSWDQTHQFCGRCGSKTEDQAGERAKICPKCGFMSFTRISPAVITAVIKEDKILLAHARAFKGNMYSLIAGFLEPGETLEEGVQREIMEEVGLRVKNIRYYKSQPWPFPNSLMIGFVADYESGEITVDGQEITDAGWYTRDNLPELPQPLSIAREIINWFIHSKG